MPKRDTKNPGGSQKRQTHEQQQVGTRASLGGQVHPLPLLRQCLPARVNQAAPGTSQPQHAQTVALPHRDPVLRVGRRLDLPVHLSWCAPHPVSLPMHYSAPQARQGTDQGGLEEALSIFLFKARWGNCLITQMSGEEEQLLSGESLGTTQ